MEIYTNGTILTMAQPATAEAVLTDQGQIICTGSQEDLQSIAPEAKIIDLQGATMLPAFLDPHSHFSSYATSFLQVALDDSSSFSEIASRVRAFIKKNQIQPGEWVIAKGYDHNQLEEKRHPDLACVDSCAPDNPLVLQHASGHSGVFNSLALKALDLTAQSPSPAGGLIGVENGRLTGYLEENAYFPNIQRVPMADPETMLAAYTKAQNGYASYGITTIQEGMAVSQMIPLYQALLARDALFLDLVAYPAMPDVDAFLSAFPQAIRTYQGHLKIGGLKIFLDGSPQGRTAWMRTPYLNASPPYYGYPTLPDETVRQAVQTAADRNIQILAHCNGDAAARQYLKAIAQISQTDDVAALRPVMIHAQLLDLDQLPEMRRLQVLPSFFVAHVYHWGDVHIRNFGLERASRISPAASALAQDIRFTSYNRVVVIYIPLQGWNTIIYKTLWISLLFLPLDGF